MDGKNRPTRAFIAIDLPESVKEKMEMLLKELPKDSLRSVSKENIHITLFFLGSIDSTKLEKIKRLLDELDCRKFYIAVNGIGTFNKNRPSVLFAEIGEGKDDIININRLLFNGIKEVGIKMDGREYNPHITIARAREIKKTDSMIQLIGRNSKKEFGRFLCESVKLKESVLTDSVPLYKDLFVKHLE